MIQDATLEMLSEKNKSSMFTFPSGLKHLNFVFELPLHCILTRKEAKTNKQTNKIKKFYVITILVSTNSV